MCALVTFTARLPAFYPIAEYSYGIKEGLPDMYMTEVLINQQGRINILKNGNGRTAFASILYEYDGTNAYPSGFRTRYNYKRLIAKPIPSEMYYGYYDYEDGSNLGSDFFTYEPIARSTKCINITESGEAEIVHSVSYAEGSFFVLVFRPAASQFEILRIRDDFFFSWL